MVHLSHLCMTTGKTIVLTIWTFVGKVMSLLFNMLSRFVVTFLPRSKCLLISWLQSPSAVILEPQKIKSDTVSPSISHEVMGPDAMSSFWWLRLNPQMLLVQQNILSLVQVMEMGTLYFLKHLCVISSLTLVRCPFTCIH